MIVGHEQREIEQRSGDFFAALGNVGCCGTVAQTVTDAILKGRIHKKYYYIITIDIIITEEMKFLK